MRLIQGGGQSDGKPKGKLVLIKQSDQPRYIVIKFHKMFAVYDTFNNEWVLKFKTLKEAEEVALIYSLAYLREVA